MPKKKAKKATAKKRRPDPAVWALPQFKALLDENGCMSCAGLKIMVENQRDINTKLYESIEAAIETMLEDHPNRKEKSSPLSKALALVRTVPGSGPPECKSGGVGGLGGD
jgi:hypothetical protein